MRELGEPMECGIFDFYKVYTQLTPSPLTIIPHTGQKWQRKRLRAGADQLPALYLILRAGAGVEAGGGRAYGVRDF